MPHLLLARYGLHAVTFRAALHQAKDPRVFEERGEVLLRVRNAPGSVKGAVGMAELRGMRDVLVGTSGDLTDFKAAFSALHPHTATHTLTIHAGDARKCKRDIEPVLEALADEGSDESLSELSVLDRMLEQQTRRQVEGACPSPEWRSFLLSVLRGNSVSLPRPGDDDDGKRTPVALLGHLCGQPDLPSYVEVFGGRVVYDEWAQLAAELAVCREPYLGLAQSPLLLGPAARFERLKPLLSGIEAVILVTEPFCASSMEEAFFRGVVRKPLLVLDCETLANLDATRLLRLENFAASAFKSGGRPE